MSEQLQNNTTELSEEDEFTELKQVPLTNEPNNRIASCPRMRLNSSTLKCLKSVLIGYFFIATMGSIWQTIHIVSLTQTKISVESVFWLAGTFALGSYQFVLSGAVPAIGCMLLIDQLNISDRFTKVSYCFAFCVPALLCAILIIFRTGNLTGVPFEFLSKAWFFCSFWSYVTTVPAVIYWFTYTKAGLKSEQKPHDLSRLQYVKLCLIQFMQPK